MSRNIYLFIHPYVHISLPQISPPIYFDMPDCVCPTIFLLTSFLESSLSSMFRPKCYRQNDRVDRRIISQLLQHSWFSWKTSYQQKETGWVSHFPSFCIIDVFFCDLLISRLFVPEVVFCYTGIAFGSLWLPLGALWGLIEWSWTLETIKWLLGGVTALKYRKTQQHLAFWNLPPEPAEVVAASAAQTPPSTRAGGQDDGTLHKLPQIMQGPCFSLERMCEREGITMYCRTVCQTHEGRPSISYLDIYTESVHASSSDIYSRG